MKMRMLGLLALLLFISACSQIPVFSLEVVTPPSVGSASTPEPTPWVGGTQTAQAVSESGEPTQEVLEKPVGFSPVLYGGKQYDSTFFLLLGGVGRDEWLTPDESLARFSGEVTYSLHSQTQAAKYFLWGETPEFSQTCGVYTIGTEASLDEGGFVAVADGWPIMKRETTELSDEAKFYQEAVFNWLAAQGVTAPQSGTLQVLRVDLENDGTDEIFISATHLDESQHLTRAGDYSIVLMRKVIGNEVVTELVVGDVYASRNDELTYPRTYTIANFIDLDQDGILEVAVAYQKWEGFGASIHQVAGPEVWQVLSAGC